MTTMNHHHHSTLPAGVRPQARQKEGHAHLLQGDATGQQSQEDHSQQSGGYVSGGVCVCV
jgi:hypothetical protein